MGHSCQFLIDSLPANRLLRNLIFRLHAFQYLHQWSVTRPSYWVSEASFRKFQQVFDGLAAYASANGTRVIFMRRTRIQNPS